MEIQEKDAKIEFDRPYFWLTVEEKKFWLLALTSKAHRNVKRFNRVNKRFHEFTSKKSTARNHLY
jgi:hypothetical protein